MEKKKKKQIIENLNSQYHSSPPFNTLSSYPIVEKKKKKKRINITRKIQVLFHTWNCASDYLHMEWRSHRQDFVSKKKQDPNSRTANSHSIVVNIMMLDSPFMGLDIKQVLSFSTLPYPRAFCLSCPSGLRSSPMKSYSMGCDISLHVM